MFGSSAEEAAKRAKDAAKDAAKKLFGGSKKFAGSGNKLGGGDGPVPVRYIQQLSHCYSRLHRVRARM